MSSSLGERSASNIHGIHSPQGVVRGTQSFVGVMAAVWKRPSLTGLELLWRWSFGVIAAALIWFFAHDAVMIWGLKVHDIGPILLRGGLVARGTSDVLAQLWPLLGGIAAWSVFAGLGRGRVVRRWDPSLRLRRGTAVVLAMLRAYAFAALVALWFTLLVRIATSCIWGPMERGLEPAYVPGFAMAVTTTLLLFVFWAAVSWILRIAPVLAMSRGLGAGASLRAAVRLGPLKSKLIEINLVMGIVKIALLVLALVFSACPLPFESVETQTFLTWWWTGVGVLYLVASDYFHVVRAAAYQALYRLDETLPGDASR
ncbi:MAG TPA: hypothetical protein VN734_08295 [Acidobacteriaceae bacterium]|nr:hypothetical protein [Acidobacteriaceae bacterium]